MKKSILLAAVAAVFGVASFAQAAPNPDDKFELSLSGIGNNDVDFDGVQFSAQAQLGYYVDDASQHQVNLRQSVIFSDIGGSALSGSTAVGYDYHFDFGQDQRVVPFVGLAIGYNYGDAVTDTFFGGPEAGVKFYVNDTTFIFGQVQYQFLFEDAGDADDSFDDGVFQYSLGVGFRF